MTTSQELIAARTLPPKPRKPPCPKCGAKLQIKCTTDGWEIFSKWRYCEKCDFDEREADEALALKSRATSQSGE